jgi:predicted transglutaminase-like cysteine proteinase
MLHKQGIEFNPFNEKQAREAARTYLGQLVDRNKGDVDKALAQYGGFITKDPSGYVNKVKQGQAAAPSTTPTAPAAPAQTSADPLEAFLSGKPATAPVQPPVQTPAQPAQAVAQPVLAAADKVTPSKIANIAAQTFNRYQDAKRDLGERVAGAIDTAYGIVPTMYGAGVQALARTVNTPQRAEQIGQAAAASIDKPLGKAIGITGSEAYQKPLGGITEPIAQQVNKMFNALGMTPEQISEKTGIPPEDIRNMVVIGSAALPQAIREVSPVVGKAVQPLREMAKELEIVGPGQLTKQQMQAQFEAAQGKIPAGSVGAAGTQNNPYFGKITGEETVRGQFPQVKLSKTPNDVPVNEQMLRSQIAQEIMPGGGVRPGVVTGNENLLRNEYTKAKLDTPEGQLFKQQIANEQTALSKYAEDRVNATGASRSLINDEQRGLSINEVIHGVSPDGAPPSSLMGYFKDSKKQIYDSAFQRVGNNQIKTANTDSFFNNAQQLATAEKDGTLNFLNGAKKEIELAKTVGYELPDGKIAPANSVAALNAVIKSNNAAWTPEKANTIRKINAAINKDIAAVADPSLYKLGDKIHRLEKELFESRGIDKIFGEVDKNGVVTSATALEKIPSKLNNMPKDQWRHIRDTLNELASGRIRNAPEGMPPIPTELMQSAKAAVAEMDGALAREVQKAGGSKMGEWNQNSANNVMNSVVGQKILETFPPNEIQKFHTLNYAGHLMPGIHGYEGAALQGRRVGLIEGNLGKLGAGTGATIGGAIAEAPGAAIGAYIGGQVGVRGSEKMAAKALNKEALKAQKEMEKAKALGKQSGQNKINDLNK